MKVRQIAGKTKIHSNTKTKISTNSLIKVQPCLKWYGVLTKAASLPVNVTPKPSRSSGPAVADHLLCASNQKVRGATFTALSLLSKGGGAIDPIVMNVSRLCVISNSKTEQEVKNWTKWWSESVEGLLSTGPTPSSFTNKKRVDTLDG